MSAEKYQGSKIGVVLLPEYKKYLDYFKEDYDVYFLDNLEIEKDIKPYQHIVFLFVFNRRKGWPIISSFIAYECPYSSLSTFIQQHKNRSHAIIFYETDQDYMDIQQLRSQFMTVEIVINNK